MGIYSRDYIREHRPVGGFGGPSDQWAIKYLIIANIAVFLLQNLYRPVTDLLSLSLADLQTFQIWRLVTYGFCHDLRSIFHLAINMFILWMFGRAIEPILGSREFMAFFLGGIVVSGLGHVGVQALQLSQPEVTVERLPGVLGASGGVMAVVFLTAMYYPRMTVLLFFVIPMQLRWLAVLYAVADVTGMLQGQSSVAHAAHLAGAAFGVLYKYYNWRVLNWGGALRDWFRFRGLRKARTRRNVRLYQPEEDDDVDDAEVDAILEKIQQQGEASLTDRERKVLKNASRRASRKLRGR